MRNRAAALIAVLAALVIGFAGGVTWTGGAEQLAGSAAVPRGAAASIMLDYGDGEVAAYTGLPVESGLLLLSLMERVTAANEIPFETREFEGLGVMIELIGERRNGDNDRYWVYWVNNTQVPVGAGQYEVQPGDVILWKHQEFRNE